MPNSTDRRKKKIAPIVVAILVILYMVPVVAVVVLAMVDVVELGGGPVPILAVLLYLVIGAAVIGGVLTAMGQRLREIDGGQWEFVPFPELAQRFPESFRIWLEDIDNARCDGGESVQELTKRVVDTITDIAQRHAGKVIFLFSHATPVRAFAAHCMGVTLSGAKAIPWPSNASVTKVEYDGASFCLMEYSIDHFMGDMATRLPENL